MRHFSHLVFIKWMSRLWREICIMNSTRSFSFKKSKENPVFHHMWPLSYIFGSHWFLWFTRWLIYSFCSDTEKTSWRGACRPCRRAGENWWSSWKVSWGCWRYDTCWTKIWLFISHGMYDNIIYFLILYSLFFSPPPLSLACLLSLTIISHLLADRMKSRNRQ